MSTSGGSSSSSSSSSGGSSYDYYNTDTNQFEKRKTGGTSYATTNNGNVVALPTPAHEAPRGASLGQSTSTGGSLTSTGYGTAVDSSSGTHVSANPVPQAYSTPVAATAPFAPAADGLPAPTKSKADVLFGGGSSSSGGGGTVGTVVNQKPTEATDKDGAPGETQTAARTDSSVVLAGQVNRRPDRSPARSNNFVSMIGSAGGLGRRSGDAKRTLIGGA